MLPSSRRALTVTERRPLRSVTGTVRRATCVDVGEWACHGVSRRTPFRDGCRSALCVCCCWSVVARCEWPDWRSMQKTVVRPRAAVDAARSSVPAGRPSVAAPKAPEAQTPPAWRAPTVHRCRVAGVWDKPTPRAVLCTLRTAVVPQTSASRQSVFVDVDWALAPAAVLLLHLGAWHRVLELSLLRWLEIRTPGRPMSADSPLSRPCPARRPTAGTGSARSLEASFAATGKTSSSPVQLSDRRPSG